VMAHVFLESTTPILTASSPEGARDYLVPARKHPGKFYALPQAPQQFKQLLMTSGFDRYFQIAPCFRDEDARGDRSPGEFYQLDMEMSFATQEDVFAICEDVLPPIFAKFGTYDIASQPPFRRIAYNDALAAYGSDKPDLRIDLTATDVTELFAENEFEALRGQTVKAVPITDCKLTRKQIDKLLGDCEVQSGTKSYWFKVDENGELAGGIGKFVAPIKTELTEKLGLKPDTLVIVCAGKLATKAVGVAIKTFGPACEGHMDKERYEFCWIVDFPMYEIGEESGELEFCHNPFSMPKGGMETMLAAERGELHREHLRVRVGDVAEEDLGADGNEFSGMGHGQPPYSLIRTRSRPAIARSHSASMSSTASSSRTSSTWGLVLGWRGVKTVQQSS